MVQIVVNRGFRHNKSHSNVIVNNSYFKFLVPIENENLSGTCFLFGAYHPEKVLDTKKILKIISGSSQSLKQS